MTKKKFIDVETGSYILVDDDLCKKVSDTEASTLGSHKRFEVMENEEVVVLACILQWSKETSMYLLIVGPSLEECEYELWSGGERSFTKRKENKLPPHDGRLAKNIRLKEQKNKESQA